MQQTDKDRIYSEHLEALNQHKALLEKLHDNDDSLDATHIKQSLERVALTLEEYFKIIGIP
ncbi:MAG: hypothetical protein ACAH12_01610 [Methylophilaceae bacterium]|uniref:hypothetical protein n=1 Tax=Methylovorus sp. MM2 TaxID=1848038 RepID=UPI0007DED0FF|nr:hypothetical protein [Methylovorus sp. MM2]OAM51583.1 hypothetical protein A7981_08880 [Methylovorus sp. MM2]